MSRSKRERDSLIQMQALPTYSTRGGEGEAGAGGSGRGADTYVLPGKLVSPSGRQTTIRPYKNYVVVLYFQDFFHSLITMKTWQCVGILLSGYVLTVCVFGLIYTYIGINHPDCNLEIDNFLEGFLFSLQSLATIGYSVESGDIFFGDCLAPAVTLTSQICCKLMIDASVIGTIFCRVSRASSRANSILFTKRAVIQARGDKLYFVMRCCDIRRNPIIGATMRLFAVHHDQDQEQTVECFETAPPPCRMLPMHVRSPTDGSLLLFMPETIVHVIDEGSPLMPPSSWIEKHRPGSSASANTTPPALTAEMKMSLISDFLLEGHIEVVAVLEGTEATTACVMQKLGSYCHDDIDFDATFEQCITRDKSKGYPIVDYDKFDETVPFSPNVASF